MRQRIGDILTTRIDWRKVLRSFVRASIKANRRSTVRRINKRFPYIHAGKRSERVAKLAISIDQSGSVGNGLLATFFAELQNLAGLVEITIVPFDTRVDPELVFVWKKGEKRHMERVMCGGTCFNAPTEYVNEHNFDGHIILTDMEAPKPVASKCQRMWMTNSAGMASSFDTSERIIEVTD
jgi:predicted metal-dependent peptidase